MAIVPPFKPAAPARTTATVRSELAKAQTRLSTRTAVTLRQEQQTPGIAQALGKHKQVRELYNQVRTLRKELSAKEGR